MIARRKKKERPKALSLKIEDKSKPRHLIAYGRKLAQKCTTESTYCRCPNAREKQAYLGRDSLREIVKPARDRRIV